MTEGEHPRRAGLWRRMRMGSATVVAVAGLVACSGESPLEPPIIVGVATDSPGISEQLPNGQRAGFEVDFYRWLTNGVQQGLAPTEVDVAVQDRETVLRNKSVELVFASYSITEERDRQVDFAGPYLQTKQGVLVSPSSPAIRRIEDLRGKSVCAQSGSTSVPALEAIEGTIVVEEVALSECIALLRAGKIVAVSTDQLLLLGYAKKYPELRVLPVSFGALQKYGIGLQPEAGTANCELLTAKIRDYMLSKNWDAAFKANFGDRLNADQYRIDPNALRPCVEDDEPGQ